MSASYLPGTDKRDVDVAENTTETPGAHALGGGRVKTHQKQHINSYQLIMNAMRTIKQKNVVE